MQYYRDLPDSLMTSKMNETFIGIFKHVPENLRLQTLQAALMLLPDENREALMTLLCFLSQVSSRHDDNQMTSSNLATCFAPSLFCLQVGRVAASTVSPKSKKSSGSKSSGNSFAMKFDQKNDSVITNKCVCFMIDNVKKLFMLPRGHDDAVPHLRHAPDRRRHRRRDRPDDAAA